MRAVNRAYYRGALPAHEVSKCPPYPLRDTSPNFNLSDFIIKCLYLDKNVNIFLTKGIEKTYKICYNYREKIFIELKNKERNKDD